MATPETVGPSGNRGGASANRAFPSPSSLPDLPVSTGRHEDIRATQGGTSNTTVTSLKWMQYGETPVVAGRNIGGMLYLGPDLRTGGLTSLRRPTIVPTLPVASSGPDISGDGMSYWPSYNEISPSARGRVPRLAG